MKCFLIIALLCASFCSFSQITQRVVRKCGYAFQTFAITACVASVQTQIGPYESYVPNSATTVEKADGSWCYQYLVDVWTEPLNKEDVPDVAKVIQSQECQLVKTE